MIDRNRTGYAIVKRQVPLSIMLALYMLVCPALAEKRRGCPCPDFYLKAIRFVDSSNGWILASTRDASFILRTLNGGRQWRTQYSTNQGLNAIAFADAKTGWVVGSNGTVLVTSDAGVTWQAQVSGATARLYGLAVIDSKTVWASGKSGTVLSTFDGGEHWAAKVLDPGYAISGIVFAGKRFGWAIGYGTVWRTNDGGATWARKEIADWKHLSVVRFANKDIGWISAGPVVLQSADGGETFRVRVVPSQGGVTGLTLLDPLHAWVATGRAENGDIAHIDDPKQVSSEGFLLSTDDGGQTWHNLLHLCSKGNFGALIADVFFINQSEGWAVGEEGLFLTTRDGGRAWRKTYLSPPAATSDTRKS